MIDEDEDGNAFAVTVDADGKVYPNITSDHSDALNMSCGWFSADGKLHLTEIHVEETEGEHYGLMAADNAVFVQTK